MRVDVVLPVGFDDPDRPSGGNSYDRQVCAGLAAAGHDVRTHAVPGRWPTRDADATAAFDAALSHIGADSDVVVVDGLIASPACEPVVAHSRRLRIVLLLHMLLAEAPVGHHVDGAAESERRTVAAVARILTTSSWLADRVVRRYAQPRERVHVATPGVEPANVSSGPDGGTALLCVAPVAAHKGHDVLVSSLAQLSDIGWECECVGSLDRDPPFVEAVRRQVEEVGLSDRIRFPGVLTGPRLDAAYARAGALILPSRSESYGMVVTEALARGLPVIATDVGGVGEALGRAPDGSLPGILVAEGDSGALAAALRGWLVDSELRTRLRVAARARRETLPRWQDTVTHVAAALEQTRATEP